MLTAEKTKVNTHASIIKDFDEKFVKEGRLKLDGSFENLVLQLNQNEPTETFAKSYLEDAKAFLQNIEAFRNQELQEA
jgi:sulfite reductase (ferredoxin)